MKYLELLIMIVAGACAGTASGIGFWPRWPQPKNIRIQLALSFIAIILWIVYFIFFFK